MDEGLFARQSTVYDRESTGVPLPVNTINDEMLQRALEKAVKNENYEMASHLRDELNRRKQQQASRKNDGATEDKQQA